MATSVCISFYFKYVNSFICKHHVKFIIYMGDIIIIILLKYMGDILCTLDLEVLTFAEDQLEL